MSSVRSYCVTVRPREGLSNATLEMLQKWLTRQDYAVGVVEMSNEARHLHAQIWLNKPRARGDVNKQLQRILEATIIDFDRAQLKVLRSGTKIAYSDWYLDYLVENDTKDPATIVVNKPPEATMGFYPTEEEQDEVRIRASAVDPKFAELEIKYNHWSEERDDIQLTEHNVAKFLCYAMYQERIIKVIVQQRDRTALCKSLYAYISKSKNVEFFLPRSAAEKKIDKKLELMMNYKFDQPSSDSE